MSLSSVQKGAVGQFAFLIIAIVTGNGQIEAYIPAADNEGRDAEIRRHLRSLVGIGIQIKVSFYQDKIDGKRNFLSLRFAVALKHLRNDPRLWYFFGCYDRKKLGFVGPVFLIPAPVFHKMGRRGTRNGKAWFGITASLRPESNDRWSRFRVWPKDLGPRLLEIIDAQKVARSSSSPDLPTDATWLFRAKTGVAKHSGKPRLASKYGLIRTAVMEHSSIEAWYGGHRRVFSPFVLGTRAGEEHVLGYQFGGSSEKPLAPDGSPANWRCLRVSRLTRVKPLPGIWHSVPKGKGHQSCIDRVDVSAYRPLTAKRRLPTAA